MQCISGLAELRPVNRNARQGTEILWSQRATLDMLLLIPSIQIFVVRKLLIGTPALRVLWRIIQSALNRQESRELNKLMEQSPLP